MPLFQKSVLKKHLLDLNTAELDAAYQRYSAYFHNATIQQNIRNAKEEQFQEGFLRELFGTVLNYTLNPNPDFNLTTELKNTTNSKKADGAILVDEKAVAVIELKGTETTDLAKIEVQAFGYKNNQAECNYVITSNFEKLRFYIDNTIDFEEFNLFTLSRDQFNLLYLCLSYDNIKNNVPKRLKAESVSQEDQVTKKLYKDYSDFKRALYNNLVELNPQYDKLLLFKKSQKLLDRFLFIFFAEDTNLLPTNLIFRINAEWKNLQAMRIPVSLYERYIVYFNDLNTGAKVTLPAFGKKTGDAITAEFEIFAYNGGLFQPDEVLDTVKIDDALLHTYSEKLSHYDFDSDVDVNILGHIFENSLNEIDEIKSEIEGTTVEKTKTKRKKDGVFYTPKYITKYIVDNTVGKLCTEKKAELKLVDEDFTSDKKLQTKTKKALLNKLAEYRAWLLQLTICDPACGSGAFLNQALEFLIAEHLYVDELQAKLMGDALILSDIETSILENNIYGVDLNDESVEIAKLSLWLRTAQKGRKLNSLNKNIKCGNSLIDDPSVAGEKAFSWEKEFPEVFARGGFDVVIGNPPYVPGKSLDDDFKKYVKDHFTLLTGKYDLYILFLEKILKISKLKSFWSVIIPNTVLVNENAAILRKKYFDEKILETIRLFKDDVFPDASVESVVLISGNKKEKINIVDEKGRESGEVELKSLASDKFFRIQVSISNDDEFILSKIEKQSILLGELSNICIGIQIGGSGNSKDFKDKYICNEQQTENHKKFLDGKDFEPYKINWTGNYVLYGDWLHRKRDEKFFLKDKVLIRQIGATPVATMDKEKYYVLNTIYSLILKDECTQYPIELLFAFINSTLVKYYWQKKFSDNKSLFPKIKKSQLVEIPIKSIIDENEKKKFEFRVNYILLKSKELQNLASKFNNYFSSQYKLEKLPNKLEKWYALKFIDFIKELNKAIKAVGGTPLTKKDEFEWMELFEENKKKALELKAEIDKTDKEIDAIVYELYELTDEEIKIVEGGE